MTVQGSLDTCWVSMGNQSIAYLRMKMGLLMCVSYVGQILEIKADLLTELITINHINSVRQDVLLKELVFKCLTPALNSVIVVSVCIGLDQVTEHGLFVIFDEVFSRVLVIISFSCFASVALSNGLARLPIEHLVVDKNFSCLEFVRLGLLFIGFFCASMIPQVNRADA